MSTRTEAIRPPSSLSRPTQRGSAARLGRLGLRGIALLYLGLMVAIPMSAVVVKGFGHGFGDLRAASATPGAMAAVRLTILLSLGTAIINGVLGTLLA